MAIEDNARTCVVLGGRGFVGRSLVFKLLQLGDWIVRVADSAHSPELDSSGHDAILSQALSSGRASYFHVDVRDKSQIIKAFEGSSVVFYTDASLEERDFYNCYMIIVQGAKNVITACRECKVKRLIYNSSANVVFDGSSDILNGDESLRCPWKFEDVLSDLKAQAEALVLFANNIDGPLTCALRPSNVFGPGDREFLPLLVTKGKSGWAKYITGTGENLSDFTYVDNVAHAHICAEEALVSRVVTVAGKAFFITNLEPVKLWEFVALIMEELGYQRPYIKLPASVVWYIISLIRWAQQKLDIIKLNRSLSDPYIFQLATRNRTFDCTAARTHLGYTPVVSLKEGVMLTVESFSYLANDSPFARYDDFTYQSKMDKLLGRGKVAEILLWRDEKKTFTYFVALAMLFYWFFLCGRTFISASTNLLMLFAIILYFYRFLPPNILGLTVRRISSSTFEISDTAAKDFIIALIHRWNRCVRVLKRLAQGDDWNTFMKVAGPLYLLKLVLSHSLKLVIGMGLVFAFSSFFIYEQYESEIDGLAKLLSEGIKELKGLLIRKLPPPAESFIRKRQEKRAYIARRYHGQ